MTGTLITAVINAGGGNRTANISAETFIALVQAAQAQGISGLGQVGLPWYGPGGPGVPAYAVNPQIMDPSARLVGQPNWPGLYSGNLPGGDVGVPMLLVYGGRG